MTRRRRSARRHPHPPPGIRDVYDAVPDLFQDDRIDYNLALAIDGSFDHRRISAAHLIREAEHWNALGTGEPEQIVTATLADFAKALDHVTVPPGVPAAAATQLVWNVERLQAGEEIGERPAGYRRRRRRLWPQVRCKDQRDPELVSNFLSDWTQCPRSTAAFTACQSDVVQPNTAGQANSESHRSCRSPGAGGSRTAVESAWSGLWAKDSYAAEGRRGRQCPKSRVRHLVTQRERSVTLGRTRFRPVRGRARRH